MLRNHLKIALRNLVKYKGFSMLNIFGLTLGIASSFVILMYVWQELTCDRHFADYNRIYRISTDFFDMGGFAKSQKILHDKIVDYKDIEAATAFDRGFQEIPVLVNTTVYRERNYFSVDSNYFKVFTYHFLEGDPQNLMRSPDEIVLSEKLAKKFFGNLSAFGKTVSIGKDKTTYRITGIIANDEHKTHLVADMWMPVSFKENDSWSSASYYNYVKLKEGSDRSELKKDLDDILLQYAYPFSNSSKPFAQWKDDPASIKFFIQPFKDIYLYSTFKFDISPNGNPTQVYILGIIGIFIILIAVVNYVNLTTARSSIRAKEVGIKKTLGAGRKSLVVQFLCETALVSFVAMLLSIAVAVELVNTFHALTGTQLVNSLFLNWQQPAILLSFVLVIGLLAGLYPAFYLTSFSPKKILKGDLTLKGNKNFRSSLVVFQFTLAIGLIICTLVVQHQLTFMQNKDKGFDETGVLIINNAGALGKNTEAFRQSLAARSQVISTSFSQRTPAGNSVWMYTYQTPQMTEAKTIQTFPADDKFIPTLGIHILQGRNFSKELASDSTAAIINEAAVTALELKKPIGAQINDGQKVIGVISDFNFQSLHEKIAPVVLSYSKEGYELAVKLQGRQHVSDFITFLNSKWKSYSNDEPLQYSFLDENFAALAEKERLLGKAVTFFTVLALLIAAIGLFALTTFTVEQRVKEIGIRKILGANIQSIVALISKDFVSLIIIAALIAFPLAWFAMNKWLQGFAYRIDISWWLFIASATIALLIALMTISVQAIKAAIANPIKSLRIE
jgi:putative ABC transport system permease protein